MYANALKARRTSEVLTEAGFLFTFIHCILLPLFCYQGLTNTHPAITEEVQAGGF
jgi:hypothetical protein